MGRRLYYEGTGRSCDFIMRCAGCRKLVRTDMLQHTGSCRCGHRRVEEVRTLSLWEWLKIRTGWIDFKYRREFLSEFSATHE